MNYSEVELLEDLDLNYLEEHFLETVILLLLNKHGSKVKNPLKPLQRDLSFHFSCPCPFHDDGKNPNGRIALGDGESSPRLYCNSCSNTWFIQNFEQETGQTTKKLCSEVQKRLLDLQKYLPDKVSSPVPVNKEILERNSILPRFGDSFSSAKCAPHNAPGNQGEKQPWLETLWQIYKDAFGEAHHDLLQQLGLQGIEAGFHSARTLELNPFAQEHGNEELNRFRHENPQSLHKT